MRLFGEEIPVQARVCTIDGFSAHADQAELLKWHGAVRPATTILVHGEENVMRTFAGLLKDTKVEIPALGDVAQL